MKFEISIPHFPDLRLRRPSNPAAPSPTKAKLVVSGTRASTKSEVFSDPPVKYWYFTVIRTDIMRRQIARQIRMRNSVGMTLVKDRKLTPFTGAGKPGDGGLIWLPLQLQLNQPHGVFVDKDGSLYISDSWNGRMIRIHQD